MNAAFNPQCYNTETITATGEKFDCDFTIDTANKKINEYTVDFANELLNEMVAGTFTLLDAITQEINFHEGCIKKARQLGFGNSARFGSHCLKILHRILKNVAPSAEAKTEQHVPETFEELFYFPEDAEPCLNILRELQPPVIDAANNYIGKNKGVIALWIKVLKNHKPAPLIKHFNDTIYKDLLNSKIQGLNLTKDASEFRKRYKRLERDKTELDIKAILSQYSQYSQKGKLGK